MKDNPVLGVLLGGLALALVGGALFAAWLIGGERLRVLATIVVVALAVALVLAASALPIRAYRRKDNEPVVEHHYHDGTTKVVERHTIDGRQQVQPEVKLFQLPPAQSGFFPEAMRAAYRAGLLAEQRSAGEQSTAGQFQRPAEIDPATGAAGAWDGEIEG